jgi:hypothetical protein
MDDPNIAQIFDTKGYTLRAREETGSTRVCQGKVEMSYSRQSRNVLFYEGCLRGGLKVDSMFWGSRAPWGRSEDRCDGAGSEADGAKPPVKPGHKMPVLGVLVLWTDLLW